MSGGTNVNHGKVSGIKSESGVIRVIIPKEDTKLLLKVSEPSEILVRNVTPDGKILGLTNYIGKKIYIVDQQVEDLRKETGMVPLFDEQSEKTDTVLKKLFEICEKNNIDPDEFFKKARVSEMSLKKREENE